MDQVLDQEPEIALNGQQPAWEKPPAELEVDHVAEADGRSDEIGMVCGVC